MQKATPHSTPCRSFSLDKESGTVNRETSGNDKESNLENDILLQSILSPCGSETERHQEASEDVCILQ